MSILLLSMMGAFADYAVLCIMPSSNVFDSRQREGISLAKQRDAYRGRWKALSTEQVSELLKRVRAGVSKAAIARNLGISRETLYHPALRVE